MLTTFSAHRTICSLLSPIAIACLVAGCATHHHHASAPVPAEIQTAPVRKANPADVATIADIVRASYEVISGPAGVRRQVRQIERDSTLYMPGTTFVAVYELHGKIEREILTPKTYWEGSDGPAAYDKVIESEYETEVGRRIERFGDVAQVRSVAVVRNTPDGPIKQRLVNYMQLYWDGNRWWITGMVWVEERSGLPIPESWVGKYEEISH